MSQGSFDIRFAADARTDLWDIIGKFGHIVITPQWIDPRLFGDTEMLGASRYTGVVLHKRFDQSFTVSGASLVWWLGDEQGIGDIIEAKKVFTSSTLDNAVTNLLPSAITKGTINEPAGTTYTGEHQWETPLDSLRTVAASMGVEYRVNPDGTFDAGPNNLVYNIDTPEIVVTTSQRSGGDPLLRGLTVETMSGDYDFRQYASRGIVVAEDSNNVKTLVGGQDRTPAPTEKDLFGNTVARTLMAESSGTPVEVTAYLVTTMNEHAIIANSEISTEFFEIAKGDLRIGDAFWAWQPPVFEDPDNEVWFRGEPIFPTKLRLIAASWQLAPGMGIYYRSPETTPVYTDLTQYIEYENVGAQRARLGIR